MNPAAPPAVKPKFIYAGIRVKSIKRSVDFYTKFLGMRLKGTQRIEETKGDVASLVSEDGGVEIELNHYDRDSPFYEKYSVGEALDHLAFVVDELDEALRTAKRMGYRVAKVVRTKTSRWAYVKDPNGIWIELCQAG